MLQFFKPRILRKLFFCETCIIFSQVKTCKNLLLSFAIKIQIIGKILAAIKHHKIVIIGVQNSHFSLKRVENFFDVFFGLNFHFFYIISHFFVFFKLLVWNIRFFLIWKFREFIFYKHLQIFVIFWSFSRNVFYYRKLRRIFWKN